MSAEQIPRLFSAQVSSGVIWPVWLCPAPVISQINICAHYCLVLRDYFPSPASVASLQNEKENSEAHRLAVFGSPPEQLQLQVHSLATVIQLSFTHFNFEACLCRILFEFHCQAGQHLSPSLLVHSFSDKSYVKESTRLLAVRDTASCS